MLALSGASVLYMGNPSSHFLICNLICKNEIFVTPHHVVRVSGFLWICLTLYLEFWKKKNNFHWSQAKLLYHLCTLPYIYL